MKERIKEGRAKQLFESRPKRSQTMDKRKNSKRMFAFPNQRWATAPNQVDIFGLDGFEPPIVDKLPEDALPYQVVKYNGKIWKANKNGEFETPEKKPKDLGEKKKEFDLENYDSKEKRERFEELTGKNVIWGDEVTKQYKKWLEKDYKLDQIASKLNWRGGSGLNLYEVKDLYQSLDMPEKELKRVMFKLYNDYYANDISSYTKDFKEFYNHRYIDVLEDKINAEKRKIKEKNKDPEKQKQALENYYSRKMINFRVPTVRKMLEARNYYEIGGSDIRNTLSAHPEWENEDIVNDLISRFKEGDLIDTDIADPGAARLREEEKEEGYRKQYDKPEWEQKLDWEIEQELEGQFEEERPEQYEKLKETEIEASMQALRSLI
jgi:hypothetical protein